jgi:cytochrome b
MAWLMKNVGQEGIVMLESLHGLMADLTVLLIAVHIGGVVWESVLHRENLVKAMFTGRKRIDPA